MIIFGFDKEVRSLDRVGSVFRHFPSSQLPDDFQGFRGGEKEIDRRVLSIALNNSGIV